MEDTSKEAVWQGFESRILAILALEQQLQDLEVQTQQVRREIAKGKRRMVQTSGCKWTDLVHEFGKAINDKKLAAGDGKTVAYQKTVRQWVLEAIANYVDHNPQSRVDEGSIRLYIDSKAPGFLDHFNQNTVYATLNRLRKGVCVSATQGREGPYRKTQYTITNKGRAELAFNSSKAQEHTS